MCSDNFQIVLIQTSDYLHMKYLHAFSGSCNLLNNYTLNFSSNYWVTIFHESMEGIFQADILYSSAVNIDDGLPTSTLIEVNVTTSTNINIISKLLVMILYIIYITEFVCLSCSCCDYINNNTFIICHHVIYNNLQNYNN